MTIDPARTVRVSRVIPAAPEEVFRAWTDPKLVLRWHAPRGGRILGYERNLVEGGAFTLHMEVSAGKVYHVFGTYRQVEFPRRLVYTWDLKEAEDWVGETVVTVEFLPEGGATRVVVSHEGFPTAEDTEGPRGGWAGCLEDLGLLFA